MLKAATTLLAAALAATALAGCGGEEDGTAPAPETAATTTAATTAPTATPKPEPKPETQARPAAPAPRTVTIVVEGGRPQGGIQRPVVREGERVVLVIRADAGESVHLHGYDVQAAVTPGKPARIAFTADVPGRFELELHHPDALLADLEVRP